MITSENLRQMVESAPDRMLISNSGELYEVDDLPDDTVIPALVVNRVSEAVKQVESGAVVHYLNRDALWAIEGFLLDRNVVDSLPDDVTTSTRLIEAVRQAGFEWHAVFPPRPEPLPS